ncbi:MAG: hypothetical protein CUN52_12425 [Phototrophicales bacterium]|nr:MAG: hypothetical protein CUN52_12425 [Phototrophicales bacterium]
MVHGILIMKILTAVYLVMPVIGGCKMLWDRYLVFIQIGQGMCRHEIHKHHFIHFVVGKWS